MSGTDLSLNTCARPQLEYGSQGRSRHAHSQLAQPLSTAAHLAQPSPDSALTLMAGTPECALKPLSTPAHLAQSMPSLLTTRWPGRGGDPLVEAVSAGSAAGSTGSRACSPKAWGPLRESRMGLSKLPEAVSDPNRLPSLQHARAPHERSCRAWKALHPTWMAGKQGMSHVLCSSPCRRRFLRLCMFTAWWHSISAAYADHATPCLSATSADSIMSHAAQHARGRNPRRPKCSAWAALRPYSSASTPQAWASAVSWF